LVSIVYEIFHPLFLTPTPQIHHTLAMNWLPDMARKQPRRTLELSYQVPSAPGLETNDADVAAALHGTGLQVTGSAVEGWSLSLPGRTRVYGLIPRELDESVDLRLSSGPEYSQLVVRCHPVETHAAHAAGLAGVLVLAAAVWIAGGLLAAVTTVIAGGLLVEVTRHWAFDALEQQLRRLTGDVGSALWPGQPAQIIVA
jgi:hypothetical protein